jgi:hypothetical protein
MIFLGKEKRGLSTMVVTILIVTLSLVAIAIVWQIISGILGSSEEDAEFAQSKFNMKIRSVSIGTSQVSLKVNRLTGPGNLEGIKFIFSDGQRTEGIENITSLEELEEKTFNLTLNNLAYSELKTVSIAAMIILSSGKKRIGNILDTYTIGAENYNLNLSGGAQICSALIPCPADIEGSSICADLAEEVWTYKTVFSCVSGFCSSEEILALDEICPESCNDSTATCNFRSCSQVSDCGIDGLIGLPFCELVSRDVYTNYIYYSCEGGYCSNEIVPRKTQDCDDFGCVNGVCNPGLECVYDSDCGPSVILIENSEQCVGNEIWMDQRYNFCNVDENLCQNNIIQVPKEGGDCSALPGAWLCVGGECIEFLECYDDSQCNPIGTCGRKCVDELCVDDFAVNSGLVNSIWPSNIAEYFDSPDLPKSEESYVNYYAKFTSGSEGRCLMIEEHVYPTPPGVNSYVRFDVDTTAVLPGDNYEIWQRKFNCECLPSS